MFFVLFVSLLLCFLLCWHKRFICNEKLFFFFFFSFCSIFFVCFVLNFACFWFSPTHRYSSVGSRSIVAWWPFPWFCTSLTPVQTRWRSREPCCARPCSTAPTLVPRRRQATARLWTWKKQVNLFVVVVVVVVFFCNQWQASGPERNRWTHFLLLLLYSLATWLTGTVTSFWTWKKQVNSFVVVVFFGYLAHRYSGKLLDLKETGELICCCILWLPGLQVQWQVTEPERNRWTHLLLYSLATWLAGTVASFWTWKKQVNSFGVVVTFLTTLLLRGKCVFWGPHKILWHLSSFPCDCMVNELILKTVFLVVVCFLVG